MDNATNLLDGQFSELITIEAPPNQQWSVVSAPGLYQISSQAPPVAPLVINTGTLIPETSPGSGRYQLAAIHVDGQGFLLTVDNGLGDTLMIANTCYYANPVIAGIPDEVCLSSAPFTLTASTGGITGMGVFTIDGQPAMIFDPIAEGPGIHIVTYTFDAGTGTPDDPTDPGCSISISQAVTVLELPNIATNNLINVPLGLDCEALIIPDMILEGTYPCMETDFIVTVFDLNGNPIGNMVTDEHLGQILLVEVTTVAGDYFGHGDIRIQEGGLPMLDCFQQSNMAMVDHDVFKLENSLSADQPTITPQNFACYTNLVTPASGTHYYQLDTFQVTEEDVYTFELSTDFGQGAAALYHNYFNPFLGPCQNLMAYSRLLDQGEGVYPNQNDIIRITVPLRPNQDYTLFTTSFLPAQTGDYQWTIYSQGNGAIVGVNAQQATAFLPLYCNDYQQILNQQSSLPFTGLPIVTGNCLPPTFTFNDVLSNGGICGGATITRSFTATNISGDRGLCTQIIDFDIFEIEDVWLPPQVLVLECNESFATLQNGYPHPSVSGYPFVQTAFGIFEIAANYCNLSASYSDQPVISTCGDSYEFVRRWFLFDDCNPGELTPFNQIIRVGDFTAPIISCINPDTIYHSAVAGSCTASINVPLPIVTDACSSWSVVTDVVTDIEVPILNAFGQVIGTSTETITLATIPAGATRQMSGIPLGCHRFRHTVTDDCSNISIVECPFCVEDLVSPVAVCDDNISVVLNNNGFGRITALDIDEGSNDNCEVVLLEVRRRVDYNPETCADVTPFFTEWGPSVDFYCCEANETVSVDLRVTDASGNVNVCRTQILVIDNAAPQCEAPEAISVNCGNLPFDFEFNNLTDLQSVFGMPETMDNCHNGFIQELVPLVNMADCGSGTIVRRFQAVDQFGNTSSVCEQFITINTSRNYEIRFPADVIAECESPYTDTVEIFSLGCESLTVEVHEQVFDVVSSPACYRVLRTYYIIDHCEYDGISPPIDITREEDCDGDDGNEAVWLLRRDQDVYLDSNNNELDNLPAAGTKETSCDGTTNASGYWRTINSNGYWRYTQAIEVRDGLAPEIIFDAPAAFCSNQSNCLGNVTADFSVVELCSTVDINVRVFIDTNNDGTLDGNISNQSLSGNYPDYRINGNFPKGNHAFEVRVADGCGNQAVERIPFEVVDCLAPAPNCTDGLSTSLILLDENTDADGDGDVDVAGRTLLATQFIAGSPLTDCSGPVRFSIHQTADVIAGSDIPSPEHIATVVTCDDIGTVMVRLYAWDNAFNPYSVQPNGIVGGPNYDFCETFLQVQDNMGLCSTTNIMGSIAGLIITEEDQPVEEVRLHSNVPMPHEMMTDPTGNYLMDSLNIGLDYSIAPERNGDYLNGVSTLDLILITKHILGTQLLNSPYKMIAADINASDNISTIDVIHLRKLILGVTPEFSNNNSWRFVYANFEFPNPGNPWQTYFPEVININDLQGQSLHHDFIAVKIGDVNLSANPNANDDDLENRSLSGTFYLEADDEQLSAGIIKNVPFRAGELNDITGCQFTLDYDSDLLELESIQYEQFTEGNIHQLAEGRLTVSWNHLNSEVLESNSILFSLNFRVKEAVQLRKAFDLNASVTFAEAYNSIGDLLDVGLLFRDANASESGFELHQNIPNPFQDRTVIGFNIPDAARATLTVYDLGGREWKRIEGQYQKGFNQIAVETHDLPISGVLYYKLETGQYTATRKMILLK
ncbi:MAG: hypothetical protein DHS20C18_07340 [Saprospiraceae bacterium]|nr:MAG: hypothetical protein DHS20C18_07340 [Saprospiraceae bacterium]